jgi:hypothetical protein
MHHSNDPSPTNLSRYDLGDEGPFSLLSGRAKLGGRVPTSGVLGGISGFMGEYWPKVANVVWQYSRMRNQLQSKLSLILNLTHKIY